ncbi:hypothetical protein C6988_06170 [Nitrosopumilus sp. b1]|uniref:putative RNA uridine N3 methyltransferase n=1 Tax=Nitrosopumilus sp. b1 TaxID=2109907 RepID=UPI0015F4A17C|nr:putative RNA uridine N3 methyltransferase [Nitrosopumilus sp. b1]KAF6242764.1 hypothetical protein C6988_06170 [Nitrosopumilus sp. b1]
MNLSIAIPDSCVSDETTLLDKSRKISLIARACAIFSVNYIYIYQDNGSKQDKTTLVTILKYLETPPFLRKRLFPKVNELKYAGVLHPLKIPSHVTPANPKIIKSGDIREGVIVPFKGKRFVDIGINELIPYFGKNDIGKRATVQFKTGYPNFSIKEITKEEVKQYWGYMIKERSNLHELIRTWNGKTILTSRKGKTITPQQIQEYKKETDPILIVFGAIDRGVYELLGNKINSLQNSKVYNFFPSQATETVRIEEALLGTLSIINL